LFYKYYFPIYSVLNRQIITFKLFNGGNMTESKMVAVSALSRVLIGDKLLTKVRRLVEKAPKTLTGAGKRAWVKNELDQETSDVNLAIEFVVCELKSRTT
jgi:hypothetical protein